jgi:putative ABC transport system ATP-binding protein
MTAASATAQPADAAAAFISVNNLSRHFEQGGQRQTVLQDVSFSLRKGETVALLGRSGSGKSTLLNLLSGIDVADKGEVRIAGTDVFMLPEQQRTLFRRQHIGFIYQFFNLIPSLTAAENIALVLELNKHSASDALQRAQQALADIGMAQKADQYPSRLSGGEQQRVAIVRALVHAPKLVLADEPTGNLDAVTGQQMLEVLRQRLQQAESTTLLVTHSLSVARSADRILTLENGIITERVGDFAW